MSALVIANPFQLLDRVASLSRRNIVAAIMGHLAKIIRVLVVDVLRDVGRWTGLGGRAFVITHLVSPTKCADHSTLAGCQHGLLRTQAGFEQCLRVAHRHRRINRLASKHAQHQQPDQWQANAADPDSRFGRVCGSVDLQQSSYPVCWLLGTTYFVP